MSWLFSRALVAEYSAGSCLDGEPSAQLNVMPTPHKFWRNDKTMEFSKLSQFGLTLQLLTVDRGEALLMSYLAAFRVRTLVRPIPMRKALPAYARGCGPNSGALLAKFDHDSCTWKTAQCSLFADLEQSLETWPRSGMTQSGMSYRLNSAVLPIKEKEHGFWPTPTAGDTSNRLPGEIVHICKSGLPKHVGKDGTLSAMKLSQAVKLWPTPCARDYRSPGRSRVDRTGGKNGENLNQFVGGLLNPPWVEWLMGWTSEWTALKPLAMDKFLEWQQQHSIYSEQDSNKEAA